MPDEELGWVMSAVHHPLGFWVPASSAGSASHQPPIERGETRGIWRRFEGERLVQSPPSFCRPQSSHTHLPNLKEGSKQAVSINTDRSASSEPELCGPQRSATQLTGHCGVAPLSDHRCRWMHGTEDIPSSDMGQADVVCAQPIETQLRCSLSPPPPPALS